MRVILFISIFLSLSLFAESLKSGADITKIMQQLDQVSENIKQKQMQTQATKPDEMMAGENSGAEYEEANKRLKQEQDLQQKEQDLLLMQKQETYFKNLEEIKRNKKASLLKRSKQIESILQKKLYELKVKREYTIPVKEYMKIGSKDYAYLKQDELDSAKRYILGIEKDIKSAKKTLQSLRVARVNSKEQWIMILSRLENQFSDMPIQVETAVMQSMPSNPNMQNLKKSYIKVTKDDSFENVKIKFVSENKVVIVPLLEY